MGKVRAHGITNNRLFRRPPNPFPSPVDAVRGAGTPGSPARCDCAAPAPPVPVPAQRGTPASVPDGRPQSPTRTPHTPSPPVAHLRIARGPMPVSPSVATSRNTRTHPNASRRTRVPVALIGWSPTARLPWSAPRSPAGCPAVASATATPYPGSLSGSPGWRTNRRTPLPAGGTHGHGRPPAGRRSGHSSSSHRGPCRTPGSRREQPIAVGPDRVIRLMPFTTAWWLPDQW